MIDGLTLDQLQIFATVAAQGSFSATARALGRAQSAVTYAVQRMEDQLGTQLFDRTGYRPTLTEAGIALLPRAKRIVRELRAFRDQARGISEGLEAELTLVVDSMFPMARVVEAMRAFGERYPTVPTRLYVASMATATSLVADRTCMLGVTFAFATAADSTLLHLPIATVEMVPVVAPCHPLAAFAGAIPPDEMQRHVQLVLSDHTSRAGDQDRGVVSGRNWRLGDLGAKHAMLLGGLGWGGMPRHMVADDLAAGRLLPIHPEEWGLPGTAPILQMALTRRIDHVPGPAARWMSEWLASPSAPGAQGPAMLD